MWYTQQSVLLFWNWSISETSFLGNLLRHCQVSLISTLVPCSLSKLGCLDLASVCSPIPASRSNPCKRRVTESSPASSGLSDECHVLLFQTPTLLGLTGDLPWFLVLGSLLRKRRALACTVHSGAGPWRLLTLFLMAGDHHQYAYLQPTPWYISAIVLDYCPYFRRDPFARSEYVLKWSQHMRCERKWCVKENSKVWGLQDWKELPSTAMGKSRTCMGLREEDEEFSFISA